MKIFLNFPTKLGEWPNFATILFAFVHHTMVDLGMYACTNTFDCACGKEASEKWQQFAEVSIVENVMIMVILLANSRAVLS